MFVEKVYKLENTRLSVSQVIACDTVEVWTKNARSKITATEIKYMKVSG